MNDDKQREETELEQEAAPFERLSERAALLAGLLFQCLFIYGILLSVSDEIFLTTFYAAGSLQLLAALAAGFSIFHILCKDRYSVVLIGLGALLLAALLALGSIPITARDALIHHLAVPKWWIEAGGVHELRWHEWSYYPMLLQMAFTGALQVLSEKWTVFLHLSFLPLIAIASVSFARTLEISSKLFPALIFLLLLLPMHIRLATEPLIDLALEYYCLMALLAFFRWAKTERIPDLIASGLFFGLALSTKYNALLYCAVFVPIALLIVLRLKARFIDSVIAAIVLPIVALAVASPWYLKNALLTFNPVYPLFSGFFGAAARDLSANIESFSSIELRTLLYEESFIDFVLLPLRMILFGQDNNPQYFDGELHFLLLLAPLAILLLFSKRNVALSGLLVLLALAYLYTSNLFSTGRIRYLTPVLPLFCIGALAVLAYCSDKISSKYKEQLSPSLKQLCLPFLLLLVVSPGLFYIYRLSSEPLKRSYLLGDLERDEYLKARIPEWQHIQNLNAVQSKDETTLLVLSGNQFYYFKNPVLSSGYFSAGPLVYLLRRADSSKKLRAEFRRRGVTRILAHQARTLEFLKNSLASETLTAEQLQLWNEFAGEFLEPELNANGFVTYLLKEEQ